MWFNIFREFAERIILCNSLVWACEETGRSGLTYIEAVECEKNAKKLLNEFPYEVSCSHSELKYYIFDGAAQV